MSLVNLKKMWHENAYNMKTVNKMTSATTNAGQTNSYVGAIGTRKVTWGETFSCGLQRVGLLWNALFHGKKFDQAVKSLEDYKCDYNLGKVTVKNQKQELVGRIWDLKCLLNASTKLVETKEYHAAEQGLHATEQLLLDLNDDLMREKDPLKADQIDKEIKGLEAKRLALLDTENRLMHAAKQELIDGLKATKRAMDKQKQTITQLAENKTEGEKSRAEIAQVLTPARLKRQELQSSLAKAQHELQAIFPKGEDHPDEINQILKQALTETTKKLELQQKEMEEAKKSHEIKFSEQLSLKLQKLELDQILSNFNDKKSKLDTNLVSKTSSVDPKSKANLLKEQQTLFALIAAIEEKMSENIKKTQEIEKQIWDDTVLIGLQNKIDATKSEISKLNQEIKALLKAQGTVETLTQEMIALEDSTELTTRDETLARQLEQIQADIDRAQLNLTELSQKWALDQATLVKLGVSVEEGQVEESLINAPPQQENSDENLIFQPPENRSVPLGQETSQMSEKIKLDRTLEIEAPLVDKQPKSEVEVELIHNEVDLAKPSNKEVMLDAIKEYVHEDFEIVWKGLFDKFDDKIVKSWSCDPNGNFTLALVQPMRVWIPSEDEKGIKDPPAGVVLLLGVDSLGIESKRISGKFDKQENSMSFNEGFNAYMDPQKIGASADYAAMKSIQYRAKDEIIVLTAKDLKIELGKKTGTIKLALARKFAAKFGDVDKNDILTVTRKKTFDNLIKNWNTDAAVVKIEKDEIKQRTKK